MLNLYPTRQDKNWKITKDSLEMSRKQMYVENLTETDPIRMH